MKTIRIIPKLEINVPNLVKSIHLERLRVLGKPENFAKYYYENCADELLYIREYTGVEVLSWAKQIEV